MSDLTCDEAISIKKSINEARNLIYRQQDELRAFCEERGIKLHEDLWKSYADSIDDAKSDLFGALNWEAEIAIHGDEDQE
jgi:hypothetical protein